jgi:hypothetical protein
MASLEFLAIILTGLGLSASILYYASVLKNAEKGRRKDIIFQSHTPRSPEYYDIFMKVVEMRDYTTSKEYEEKYSQEERNQANYILQHFNVIGVLFLDKIATGDEIFQIYPPWAVILLWESLEPIIHDLRVNVTDPEHLKPFESLYHEARRRNPNYVPYWKRTPPDR